MAQVFFDGIKTDSSKSGVCFQANGMNHGIEVMLLSSLWRTRFFFFLNGH